MICTYKVLEQDDIGKALETREVLALDILLGLSEYPKKISPKYLYDKEGSLIFKHICDLEEYYLTRCEFEILETYKDEICQLVSGQPFNLIELGAGDGRKTSVILKHFLELKLNFRYIPIDISEPSMQELIQSLKNKLPEVETYGLVSEYFNGIKWLGKKEKRKNMILFLGSNIGNFSKSKSYVFLRSLWNSLNHGDIVLIGFDLKKDIDLMLKAYNDSKGLTSKFNLNLLKRINYELNGNFALDKFRHFSNYDVYSGAIESYLVSLEKQTVLLKELEQSFSFDDWEAIHTEYSYKYLESDIKSLAKETGFIIETQFYDSKKYFVDSVWRVNKLNL